MSINKTLCTLIATIPIWLIGCSKQEVHSLILNGEIIEEHWFYATNRGSSSSSQYNDEYCIYLNTPYGKKTINVFDDKYSGKTKKDVDNSINVGDFIEILDIREDWLDSPGYTIRADMIKKK